MIGIVSRLTDQKGFDLISCVMDEMCQDAVQFVILGTGEERYEICSDTLTGNMARAYQLTFTYSEERSHKVYAACDAFFNAIIILNHVA